MRLLVRKYVRISPREKKLLYCRWPIYSDKLKLSRCIDLRGVHKFKSIFELVWPSKYSFEKNRIFAKMVKYATFSKEICKDLAEGKNAVLSITDIFWQSKVVQMYRLEGGHKFKSIFELVWPFQSSFEKNRIFSKLVKYATFRKEICKDFADGKKMLYCRNPYVFPY